MTGAPGSRLRAIARSCVIFGMGRVGLPRGRTASIRALRQEEATGADVDLALLEQAAVRDGRGWTVSGVVTTTAATGGGGGQTVAEQLEKRPGGGARGEVGRLRGERGTNSTSGDGPPGVESSSAARPATAVEGPVRPGSTVGVTETSSGPGREGGDGAEVREHQHSHTGDVTPS